MRTLALAVGGVILGIVAYRVQIDAFSPRDKAATQVAIGWAFLLAGLVAWARRPNNRLGPLMVITAFALLARQLRYSHDATLFTVFLLFGDLCYALVGHTVFAYPFGRVRGLPERVLVWVGYTTVVAFPFAVALLHGAHSPLLQFTTLDPRPRESLIAVATNDDAVQLLQKAEVFIFYGVLATLFIALIVRRLVTATPRMRRVLAPLFLAAVVIAMRAVWECVFTFVDAPFASDYLFWWQAIGLIALPLALLAGLLRARLARATVGDLLVELEHMPTDGLRDALARSLGDPTLELGLWLPDRREFVDAHGTAVVPPPPDWQHAVTRVEGEDGEPLAVLIHDPSLLEEPALVRSTAAAARMALENARLHAELRVQLHEVEESRKRIASAADEERRRIERDLHDGAQQSLLGVALDLREAQRRLGGRLDPEAEAVIDGAIADLQTAVEQLRELAHGVHPTLLEEGGLETALAWVAARSPLKVTLDVTGRRYPPEVESAAYFVACEALLNVAKHAQAATATVRVREHDGRLVVEVTDDGVGGAHMNGGGSGLRGLSDRVEAVGGRLTVSTPVRGTTVHAEIPCAS